MENTSKRKVWWKDLSQWRKGQIAIAAAIAVVVSQNLLPENVEVWTTTISSALGALLTVLVPNSEPVRTGDELAGERPDW